MNLGISACKANSPTYLMCLQRLQAQHGEVFDLWMFFVQQERAWKIVFISNQPVASCFAYKSTSLLPLLFVMQLKDCYSILNTKTMESWSQSPDFLNLLHYTFFLTWILSFYLSFGVEIIGLSQHCNYLRKAAHGDFIFWICENKKGNMMKKRILADVVFLWS